jgi:hypothetical protein
MSVQSILILGAGELGLSVARALSNATEISSVHVLRRDSSINSTEPKKVEEITSLRSLGVHIVGCDLVGSTTDELAELFHSYPTIIN